MGELLRTLFVQKGIVSQLIVQARRGARTHLVWTLGYNTVCGVNHVCMQMVTRDRIWMHYPAGPAGQPGRDRVEALEQISKADLMRAYTTCKECRAKVAALTLLWEGKDE